MAETIVSCPPLDVLEGIAIGQRASASMESHLAACDSCRAALQRIHEDNQFLCAFAVDGALPTPARAVSFRDIVIPGYEIVREIHRGGQGVVYQAVQQSTHRDVAIKIMKQGPFATLSDRVRFDREIETLGRLDHPNIVTVHDAGVVAGFHFFVMNYVDGVTMDQTITPPARRTRDELLRSIELFAKVCDAVHAAHLRGVIHRDLKPSNIRVDASGEPHVLDFGLATSADAPRDSAMTQTGQFVGSLPWASPEQVEGSASRVDLRTDIYSLGAILFQLLTGAPPHDTGGNLRDAYERVLLEEPRRPGSITASRGGERLDEELDTIVLKCLAKRRDRRYQSAADLARDLRRYLAGEPIEARRDSALYVLRKTMRRYRRRVAIAGGLALALAAFGVVMAVLYRHSTRMEQAAVRSAASLAELLTISNIEQGRMAGVLGNIHQAEQLLWTELLTQRGQGEFAPAGWREPPGPPEAYWALWELYRRNPCRRTFTPSSSALSTATLCHEGPGVWVASADGTVERLDESGRIVDAYRAPFPSEPGLPSVDSTGRITTYHSAMRLAVWKRDGGEAPKIEYAPNDRHRIGDSCVAPGGERFAVIIEGSAVVWNIDPPERIATFASDDARLTAIAFSPDSARIAARDFFGGLHMWDIAGGAVVAQRRADRPAREGAQTLGELCFSPDGTRLADGWAETEGRIWDVTSPTPTYVALREQPGTYRVHGFSPDGSMLAIGDPGGVVRTFDARTGERLSVRIAHEERIRRVAFTHDGGGIWTCGERQLRLWDVRQDDGVRVLPIESDLFHSVDFGGSSGRFLAGGRAGLLHRVKLETMDVETEPIGSRATISCVASSPDGKWGAAATYANTVHLWNEHDVAEPARVLAHPAAIRHCCFSPDSTRIATACDDRIVRIWRCDDGALERQIDDIGEPIPHIAFEPNGRRLAIAVRDGSLLMYDIETGRAATWSPPTNAPLRAVCFSPNGNWLFAAGAGRVIEAWDVSRAQRVATMAGHAQEIYCLDVSWDGELLVSGDSAGDIRMWHVELRRPLASLGGHSGSVMALRFSRDGHMLASASLDGTVRIWDLDYYSRYVYANAGANIDRVTSITKIEDARTAGASENPAPASAEAWRIWVGRQLLLEQIKSTEFGYPQRRRPTSDESHGE